MERIAHPRGPQPERREPLVILNPNLFIFECVGPAKFAGDVPRQRVNLPTLLHVLDDDGEIGFFP